MAKKAEFVFVGDAESVIRAAKAAGAAQKALATETTQASGKIAGAHQRVAQSGEHMAKSAEGVHLRMRKSFLGMTASAAKMGVGIVAAYASIEGAKKAVETTETLAHSTLQLHKNLGLSVKSASEWAAVAKSRDVDAKALNMSFGTLSRNVSGATHGTKASVAAFKELGISQKELKGQNFESTLGDVADSLKKLGPGADRTALSMKLFGRGWQTVVPILRGGSKEMQDQLDLADKYGATFGGKGVNSLEEFIKAQREAKLASLGLQVAFGTQVAPALTKVIGAVSHFTLEMREGTGTGGKFADVAGKIAQKAGSVASSIRNVVSWFQRNKTASDALVITLGAVVSGFAAFKIVTTVLKGMAALRGAVIALNFAFAANPVGVVVIGLGALAAGLVIAYRRSQTFRDVVKGAFKVLRTVAADTFDVITAGLRLMLTGIAKVAGIASHLPVVGDKFKGIASSAQAAADKIGAISAKIRGLPSKKTVTIDWNINDGKLLTARQFLDALSKVDPGKLQALSKTPPKLHRATGGTVPGSGRGDTVPAMLEPGEFVIRRAVVEKFGPTFFAGINGGAGMAQGQGRVPGFSAGGIVSRANAIDGKHFPYVWGGGHSRTGTPDGGTGRDPGTGYDCSGAVSAVLGVSPPRVSGGFESWGRPGPGKPMDTKVYANADHVFMVINGRGWGTSRENPGGGAGWLSYNSRPGFVVRHTEDAGATGKGGAVAGNKQETSEAGKATKAAQRTAKQERSGSRLVNALTKRFGGGKTGFTAASRGAAALGARIEDADTSYGQLQRRFDQSDEDLGTPGGRQHRLTEIAALRVEKGKQLVREKKRAAYLVRAIAKTEALLKAGRKARDKAHGAKRAKISDRLHKYDSDLTDYKSELHALGFQIKDTELDIGDLDKEASDVASTPNTDADSGGSSSGGGADTSAADAAAQAAADTAQAERDLAAAIAELAAQIKQQNDFAASVVGITSTEAVRALSDVISGQLGGRVQSRSSLPDGDLLARV